MHGRALLGVVLTLALAACGGADDLPFAAGVGPEPALPEPRQGLLPTVAVARAEGWAAGETPVPAPGLAVAAFAQELDHPRWLHVLPNGDVLVAETNRQPAPARGLGSWVETRIMRVAGAEAGAPSADRISPLRNADGDGIAETRSVLLDGLTSPYGMALVGEALYVADTDALLRFPYRPGETRIAGRGERLAALPANLPNRHWTKGLIASPVGRRLYVSVGSNSDHGEKGLAAEEARAAVWKIDAATGAARVLASGLRNPVGLDFEPRTGALWTVVNERGKLGNNLVPDYLARVREGGFYGWPYSYYGDNLDPTWPPARSSPTTRSAPTWRRWGSPSRKARGSALASTRAHSSASTGRGTGAPKRLQGRLCALRGRRPVGDAGRRAHGLSGSRRRGARPPRGRGRGRRRSAAGRGRRRDYGLAGGRRALGRRCRQAPARA